MNPNDIAITIVQQTEAWYEANRKDIGGSLTHRLLTYEPAGPEGKCVIERSVEVGWLPLLLMLVIGGALSIAGFMTMRNPFLICRMPFTRRGYYERLFLDTTERNQFRGMSGCMSLFGILMLLSASQVFLKSSVVSALTTAFFETLFAVVMGVCVTGMVLLVVDLVRGRLLKKFVTFWKPLFAAPKPEECPVLPEITPKMKREAMIFTIGFVGTVLVGIVLAITRKP